MAGEFPGDEENDVIRVEIRLEPEYYKLMRINAIAKGMTINQYLKVAAHSYLDKYATKGVTSAIAEMVAQRKFSS